MNKPEKTTIVAYLQGSLSSQDHKTVELWLDTQSESTVNCVLEEACTQVQSFSLHDDGQTCSRHPNSTRHYYFTPDLRKDRYRYLKGLGAGGMGIVELAEDKTLVRKVAVKRSRPRAFDESVKNFRQRLRLFQREAEIVSRLEHPGIIPIHEIGVDRFGNPAMIMKPLYGVDFEAWRLKNIQENGSIDLAAGIRIVTSVAQAIAYAHDLSIVHRDIKVDNIVIGEHGEVTVIDWGLAIDIGEKSPTTDMDSMPAATGVYGTPSWMAPEQALAATPDPRMDVWAIGGLLLFLFTGIDPRPDINSEPSINVEMIAKPIPLGQNRLSDIPKGLQAVIKRCLSENPQRRYRNAGEVVEELRRWVKEGVTKAQQPGFILRMKALVRRSPLVSAIVITLLCAAVAAISTEMMHRYNYRQGIIKMIDNVLKQTDMSDMKEVMTTQRQVGVFKEQYGYMPALIDAEERLQDAHVILERHYMIQETEKSLNRLDKHFRETGPWETEFSDRKNVLSQAGIPLQESGSKILQTLKRHHLSERLVANLAHMQVAALIRDKGHRQHNHSDHDVIAKLITNAQLGSSWAALGEILHKATVSAHEITLRDTSGNAISKTLIDQALANKDVGDLLLALCQPNRRLIFYSHNRILTEPDAFWPRIILARDSLIHRDLDNARLHALVALGREGGSLWPKLMLAYIELLSQNLVDAQMWAGKILTVYPDHLETRVLRAVIVLESGNKTAAQYEIDQIAAWGHFHVHEQYGGGHPMDIAIDLLKKKNIRLHK